MNEDDVYCVDCGRPMTASFIPGGDWDRHGDYHCGDCLFDESKSDIAKLLIERSIRANVGRSPQVSSDRWVTLYGERFRGVIEREMASAVAEMKL